MPSKCPRDSILICDMVDYCMRETVGAGHPNCTRKAEVLRNLEKKLKESRLIS